MLGLGKGIPPQIFLSHGTKTRKATLNNIVIRV